MPSTSSSISRISIISIRSSSTTTTTTPPPPPPRYRPPVADACGVSSLAQWGILVKSTRQMELLAQLRTVALDKTGTVTEGHFRLMQVAVEALRPPHAGSLRPHVLVACDPTCW